MMTNFLSSPFKPSVSTTLPTRITNMNRSINPQQSDKVVFILGTTASGKTRLSVDLAGCFNGEVINSDCMQVYKGLDIASNKVTREECRGVPHHLLGFVDPNEDFTTQDFVHHASRAVNNIVQRGKLPIIAGGSNYWVKALANDDIRFRDMYKCCFIWVDVEMPVLHDYVAKRVDRMVAGGLVEEGRDFFNPSGDYCRGVRRSIGVPELHWYYKNEAIASDYAKDELLEWAIDKIKSNTCDLTCYQYKNILELKNLLKWKVHRLNATEVLIKSGNEADEAWKRLVSGPVMDIVDAFLQGDIQV